jgi:hypothetical protein
VPFWLRTFHYVNYLLRAGIPYQQPAGALPVGTIAALPILMVLDYRKTTGRFAALRCNDANQSSRSVINRRRFRWGF